jgi:hypothetical protein
MSSIAAISVHKFVMLQSHGHNRLLFCKAMYTTNKDSALSLTRILAHAHPADARKMA